MSELGVWTLIMYRYVLLDCIDILGNLCSRPLLLTFAGHGLHVSCQSLS